MGLPKIFVTLAHEFRVDPQRREYHRVGVVMDGQGTWMASSTGGQRSSMVGSLKSANALLCLPVGKEPLRKGARVEALLMGRVRSLLDGF